MLRNSDNGIRKTGIYLVIPFSMPEQKGVVAFLVL
jgi:hypothetical protein